MTGRYAVAMRAAFAPFVGKTLEVLVPLCAYKFHPDTRSSAAAALPALLEAHSLALLEAGAVSTARCRF